MARLFATLPAIERTPSHPADVDLGHGVDSPRMRRPLDRKDVLLEAGLTLASELFGLRPGILADRQLNQALEAIGEEVGSRLQIPDRMKLFSSPGRRCQTSLATRTPNAPPFALLAKAPTQSS
jgi:hypothetical protein